VRMRFIKRIKKIKDNLIPSAPFIPQRSSKKR
jgi:hypothetical protein